MVLCDRCAGPLGDAFTLLERDIYAADRVVVCDEKRNQSDDDAADGPDGIPALWMIVGDRQADARVHLKATTLGDHADGWRLPRVGVSREAQLTQIISTLVRLIG